MAEQDKPESGLKRLTATLGRSAEYSIALGLIVVCVIVAGALWLPDSGRKLDEKAAVSVPTPGHDRSKIAEEEKAALAGWNQQLEGDFKEIEQAQRRSAEEAAQRERQRQEAERDEERAAADDRRQPSRVALVSVDRLLRLVPNLG